MTAEIFFIWLFFIIATEAITEIIVDAKITESIRSIVKKRAHPLPVDGQAPPPVTFRRKIWIFIDDLINCGYCTSVWVAGFLGLFAPFVYKFDHDYWFSNAISYIINWLIAAMVLHRLSNFFHVLFMIIKRGRVKSYDIELKLQPVEVKPIQHNIEGVIDGSFGQCIGEGAAAAK